jgi:DNA-binding CsgD family transcriptional regulator
MLNLPPDAPVAEIERRRKVVGRSPDADIGITARFRSASRRHAEVWRDDKGLMWIRDLGSAVGSCVNRLWIGKMRDTPIAVGDQVWLGGAHYEIVAGLPSAESSTDTICDASLTGRTADLPSEPLPHRFSLEHLTPAECDVVLWLTRGYTTDEDIAEKLHRSPHTVRTHVANIFEKLGLHSRVELISWLQRFSQ